MKKKIIVSLLTLSLFATLLSGCSGCGNKASETVSKAAVVETTESIQESEAIEESEVIASEEIEVVEAAVEEIEETEIVATEVVEVEETEIIESQATETEETETKIVVDEHGYSYTELDKTMYAKSSVNVRDLPSTDGNRVDGLSTGQEVKVTGQCVETGWYRLEGDKYVSNNYLVNEKPAAPDSSGGVSNGTTQVTNNTMASAQLAGDFVGILNKARKEAGLSEVSLGDTTLQNGALNGAVAISSNYSHSALSGGSHSVSNIGRGFNSTQSVFDAWMNSPGHKAAMMQADLETVACAYFNGYFVYLGKLKPVTAESVQEKIDSGEYQQIGETAVDQDTGASVTVYADPNAVSVVDPNSQEYADVQATLKELGLIP